MLAWANWRAIHIPPSLCRPLFSLKQLESHWKEERHRRVSCEFSLEAKRSISKRKFNWVKACERESLLSIHSVSVLFWRDSRSPCWLDFPAMWAALIQMLHETHHSHNRLDSVFKTSEWHVPIWFITTEAYRCPPTSDLLKSDIRYPTCKTPTSDLE